MRVGPPATRTDEYLAAILEELRALRTVLAGGGQDQPAPAGVEQVVDRATVADAATHTAPAAPTKRTRQRARTPA
jgi:hypothetical protein